LVLELTLTSIKAAATRRNLRTKLPLFLILLVTAITTTYPLLFVAANAFKKEVEYYSNVYGLPHDLYLGNFALLQENLNVLRAVGNSAFVVCIGVLASTLLAALASFPIAKLRFSGKRPIFLMIISFMLIPGQVLLIPIYLLFANLGLINNYLSVILVYVVTTLPFGIFLLTSSFVAIPTEMIDSAKVDGASLLRIFRSIILPMGRPAVTTLAVLNFLTMWNELLLGMVLLPDESKRLLTPTLATLIGRLATNQPVLMAGLLISALPTVLMLIIFSRYLIKGITLGVGK
jgi:ABC-type glycerol-3-phosphate transport system permease component